MAGHDAVEQRGMRAVLGAALSHARVLPRAELIALACAALPIVLCAIGLKLLRVLAYDQPLSLLERASLVQSDLLAGGAVLACVLALGALGSALRLARTLLVLTQLLLLPLFALAVLAHGYNHATGSTLDFGLIAYSLSRTRETWPIVANEATPLRVAMIVVVLGVLFALPWLARSRSRRRAPETSAPRRADAAIACAVFSLLSALFGYAGYQVHAGDLPMSFASDAALYVLRGYLTRDDELEHVTHDAKPRKTGAQSLVRGPNTAGWNVVAILLESTRHDATSVYQSRYDTTPYLTALAKESTVVERAYAVMPHTSKALVSSLCGFDPRASVEITESAEGGLPGQCLAKLLAKAGYATAFFQAPRASFESRRELVRNMGYQRFWSGDMVAHAGFEKVNYFGFEDDIMLEPSRKWLERVREPFFATYLTATTHHPYGTPKRMPKQRYAKNRAFNDYLNAQRYDDDYVRKVMQQYRDKGLLERTVFLIFGDHGEAFGEHGLYAHNAVVYEVGLRVPLLLRMPASVRSRYPARVAGPISQLAIVPTLLSVLGFQTTGEGYEAPSIFSGQDAGPLYAGCFTRSQCLARIEGRHKLIYHYRDRPPELYDVLADPRERNDLAKSQPELVKRMVADARAWSDAVDETYYRSSGGPTIDRYVTRTPPQALAGALARFGDWLELHGCSTQRRSDGHFDASCVYHVLGTPPAGVRLRIREEDGDDRAFQDHSPVKGFYPPHRWRAGEYVTDEFKLPLPKPLRDKPAELCLLVEDKRGEPIAPSARNDGRRTDPCVHFATSSVRPEDLVELK